MKLNRLYRRLAGLRRVPASRRDPAWSLSMAETLLAIQSITGRWESY